MAVFWSVLLPLLLLQGSFKTHCVNQDSQPDTVDGNWGMWSRWRACSRTCGGGIESSKRQCNNPSPSYGGKYCSGDRKRYRTCNIHDCPINSLDYRALQCAKYNDVNFRGKLFRWKPFLGSEQCSELCCAVGRECIYSTVRQVGVTY